MSPRTRIKNFVADKSGNIAIIFALASVPVVAVMGAAVDYGTALTARTELQTAVDVAAAAGARLPATSKQNRIDAVLASFKSNLAGRHLAASEPTIVASNAEVKVSASATVKTSFMGLVGINSVTIKADAAARSQIENGGVACVIALNPSAPDGLHMQGINKFSSTDCWTWINSTSAEAINAVGAAQGSAQGFCTAGKVVGPEHFYPTPYTECEPFADPFKNKLPAPASLSCNFNNKQYNNGTHELEPGVYCGGLKLKPQAIATLKPGVYVIKDGDLEVQAQSELSGTGVVFYFTGTAGIDIRGGGSVDVKAPVTGDYAGFAFVQEESANPGDEVSIQGGGNLKIQGIMYTPTWRINVSGNGEMNQNSDYFAMIADTFYMEGNGRLHIKSDAEKAGLPNRMPKIKNGPVILK